MNSIRIIHKEQTAPSKGGTKLVRAFDRPCMHPGHNPPSHQVFKPGEYEHTCPGCRNVIHFVVPLVGL